MNKETIIVNLYGAPGAGKSSGAAYIFYKLKQAGIDCELVTEYAKDKVWEGHDFVFKDQCYIFGHQHYRLARVYGKVDVIVTDSPLLISAFYSDESVKRELTSIAFKVNDQYIKKSLSYFVKRTKEYNPNGRFQNEEESDRVAYEMKEYLNSLDIRPFEIEGNEEGYNKVVKDVLAFINGENEQENTVFKSKFMNRYGKHDLVEYEITFTPEQMEKLHEWSRRVIKNGLADAFEPVDETMELTNDQWKSSGFPANNPKIWTDGLYIVVINGEEEDGAPIIMNWLGCRTPMS